MEKWMSHRLHHIGLYYEKKAFQLLETNGFRPELIQHHMTQASSAACAG